SGEVRPRPSGGRPVLVQRSARDQAGGRRARTGGVGEYRAAPAFVRTGRPARARFPAVARGTDARARRDASHAGAEGVDALLAGGKRAGAAAELLAGREVLSRGRAARRRRRARSGGGGLRVPARAALRPAARARTGE